MAPRPDIEPGPARERLARFLIVAAVLALLVPLTYLAREHYVEKIERGSGALQQEAVTAALERIERHFESMQSDLIARARQVATHPVVANGLRVRLRSGLSIGPESIVDYFRDLNVPYGTSVEVYDASMQLVAWNGFSIPVEAASVAPQFLDSFQTAIANDAGLRQALVVWWPIRDGFRTLGVIRAMHLIGFDAPIRNEYIRDVSLAQEWRRLTELPVTITFDPATFDGASDAAADTPTGAAADTPTGAAADTSSPGEADDTTSGAADTTTSGAADTATPGLTGAANEPGPRSRILEGPDGTPLLRVTVDAPTPERLVERTSARFNDVMVFWTVLLLFWTAGGVWYLYRRGLERLSTRRGALWRTFAAFGVVAAMWWMIRFILLALDVPGRWQPDRAPLSPLFDPIHFASGFGGGLLQSTGDFLLTCIFWLIFAAALLELAGAFRHHATYLFRMRDRLRPRPSVSTRSAAVLVGTVAAGTLAVQGLTLILSLTARHVVLDSTLDFFARKGLVPEALLLVIFCTLILAAVGTILLSLAVVWITASTALRHTPFHVGTWPFWLALGLGIAAPLVLLYTLTAIGSVLPAAVSLSMLAVAVGLAVFTALRDASPTDLLILRSILPAIFLVTVLLYPMLYSGMDARRRIQIVDAAETFSEGRDPRVLFALEQLLRDAREDAGVRAVLSDGRPAALDSIAGAYFRGSLLASLPAYRISLTFFDEEGRAVGRYFDTGQMLDAGALRQVEPLHGQILHQMYVEAGAPDVVAQPVTGLREPDRFQFEGIAPVVEESAADTIGWVAARAEPEMLLREGGTPFPRVLLPSGSYDDLFSNLSIAEFRDGLLARSMGRDFGRFRLPSEVMQALATEPALWRTEEVEERVYETYYVRRDVRTQPDATVTLMPAAAASAVVAVRAPSLNTFDHLYYLLRLTVAGLFIGLPLYLLGLYLRYRQGLLPAPRVRFRDKVLNAFLGVGIISVAAVGIVGLEVVTAENERAVQSWLRQHLERVEETLAYGARGEEMPYSVLRQVRIDSLAARVGLDLNVYSDHTLVDLSRPQLVRDRLIDQRLPIEAYQALYFEGFRFTYTDERVGNFTYTTGFRALPDEQGRPRYVVSVPTLPEQERIEEERSRTVAYLFGSLLLLVIVVMLTASLLANAISRPIARLRSGLKAVAAGRFERMLPVDSRDEIGELVETFNEMQQQLAESRRKLAQQERQLAWREMARQVAHEIKNPLTPMKLSVQHLRRAFDHQESDPEARSRFAGAFDRITSTLIEQIDTLARIANEFHSFARMPSRIMEYVDLNAVVEEAVALMQEESDVTIEVDFCDEPLVVEADREELRRNYINLIKNAMQAIPEPETGRVRVHTERLADEEGAWAYSTVNDNGMGVAEDVRDRIFEPNFSTKTSGTGLGLAIVKKSIEELQGAIDFETTEGEGTTFWIRLPLADEASDA